MQIVAEVQVAQGGRQAEQTGVEVVRLVRLFW